MTKSDLLLRLANIIYLTRVIASDVIKLQYSSVITGIKSPTVLIKF